MQKASRFGISGIVRRALASTLCPVCSISTMGFINNGKPSFKAGNVYFIVESVAKLAIIFGCKNEGRCGKPNNVWVSNIENWCKISCISARRNKEANARFTALECFERNV